MVRIPEIPTARIQQERTPTSAAPSIAGEQVLGESIRQLGTVASEVIQRSEQRKAANYTSKSTADFQQRQSAIFREARDNPGEIDQFTDTFVTQFDEDAKAVLENAPNPEAKELAQERLNNIKTSFLNRSLDFQSAESIRQQKVNLEGANDSLAKAAINDPDSIPELLAQWGGDAIAGSALGVADKEEALKKGRNNIITSAISGTMLNDPARARQIMKDNEEDLDASDLIVLRKQIKSRESAIAREQAEIAETEFNRGKVIASLSGDFLLDPKSRDDQKAVDDFVQDIPFEDNVEQYIEVAKRTKIIPTKLGSRVNAMLSGGSTEQQLQASKYVDELHKTNPMLTDQINSTMKAKSFLISQYVSSGVAPGQAIEFATRQTDPLNEASIKLRKKDYTDSTDTDFDDNDFLDVDWIGGPERVAKDLPGLPRPQQIEADYQNVLQGYYLNSTMDMEAAQELAARDIQRQWSVTEVAGKRRWMKRSPEKEYGVYGDDRDSEWINMQLKAEVSEVAIKRHGEEDSEQVLDNLILTPNPLSFNKKNVDYMVFFTDNKGIINPVINDDGLPLSFVPDFEKSEQGIAARRSKDINDSRLNAHRKHRVQIEQAMEQEEAMLESRF
jgi:hypothetical protein